MVGGANALGEAYAEDLEMSLEWTAAWEKAAFVSHKFTFKNVFVTSCSDKTRGCTRGRREHGEKARLD